MLPKLDSATLQQLKKSWNHKCSQECVSLEAVIEASLKFWDKFPSDTARLHVLQQDGVSANKLTDFVNSVYPIVHHSTISLMVDFLQHKRTKGSNVERKLYADLDLLGFVDRLLKKRPLSFLGTNDRYLLKDLKKGNGFFESIGKDHEQFPLVLSDLLSYDEMRVSALLSVSSWSVFVNNGRRKNNGEKDKSGTFQSEGVIVGQVGPRLKKNGVMEYLDCLVSRKDNTEKNGFGCRNQDHINSVWSKFLGGNLPTYESANSALNAYRDGQPNSCEDLFEYMDLDKETMFNVTVYKKRIAITAEILLCEANTRAKACNKKAYVHVVGLGLGVLKASPRQEKFFVEAWGDALKNMSGLDNVAHVDFSWINCSAVHGVKHGEKFPNTNITIHFSERNLHDLVPVDCMLVCNYAWDGNSLPGNEFWMGKICSTGDSAAACSSCVAEIHNHLLNPLVCAATLRVTTCDGRVLPVVEFVEELSRAEANIKPHQKKVKPHQEKKARQETPTSAGIERGTADIFDANADKNSWAACSFSAKKEEAYTSYDVDMNETSGTSGNSDSARAEVSVAIDSTVDATAKPSSVDKTLVTDAAVQQSCGLSQRDVATLCSTVTSESKPVAAAVIPKMIPHPSIPGLSIDNRDYVATPCSTATSKSKPVEAAVIPKMIPHPTIPGLSIDTPDNVATPCCTATSKSKPVEAAVIPKMIRHPSIPGLKINNSDYTEPGKSNKKKKSVAAAVIPKMIPHPTIPDLSIDNSDYVATLCSTATSKSKPVEAAVIPKMIPHPTIPGLSIDNPDYVATLCSTATSKSKPVAAAVIPNMIPHPTIPGLSIDNPDYVATLCSTATSKSKPVAAALIPKMIRHPSIPGLSIDNPDYTETGKSNKKKKSVAAAVIPKMIPNPTIPGLSIDNSDYVATLCTTATSKSKPVEAAVIPKMIRHPSIPGLSIDNPLSTPSCSSYNENFIPDSDRSSSRTDTTTSATAELVLGKRKQVGEAQQVVIEALNQLEKVCALPTQVKDTCSSFGDMITQELRAMTPEQQMVAKKCMSEIAFLGNAGLLHRELHIVNGPAHHS